MAGLIEVSVKGITKRGLTDETCQKFGYGTGTARFDDGMGGFKDRPVQIATYCDDTGTPVAQKLRTKDKDFRMIGETREPMLFGRHLWSSGGKKIVITEGEIDCMSVSQAQGNKWPVVSIDKGTKGAKKTLAKNLEWLCTFDEVILMFDNDEAGHLATAECAPLFPVGKCKVAKLPSDVSDPNELLVNCRAGEIINAMWKAEAYRPDGIVTLADIRDEVMKPVEWGRPWFSPQLTEYTYGRRNGEVYAFGAGTGVGKTDFLTQQVQYDVSELKEPVGLFFLEQQPKETARRLAGKFTGQRFHIPDAGWTEAQLIETIDAIQEHGKLFLYDSFGTTDWDKIRDTIRFLHHSEGVELFYIDHLTALADHGDNERGSLETIMAEMGGLVKEIDITIHLVSHLATPEGNPHEEGGRVMIRHFKGSRAIGFWCHYMFGLERFQQHEDTTVRSTTFFRILKDRYTGNSTGEIVGFGYDVDKGLLLELHEEETRSRLQKATGKGQDLGFKDETNPVDDDVPF